MKNTKRILIAVLALALLCLQAPCAGVSAADKAPEFDVRLAADKTEVGRGETVTFTVSVENISAAGGLLSVDIPFRFDPAVFSFVSKTARFPSVWSEPADFSYAKPKADGLLWLRMLNDDDKTFSSSAGCTEDGAISFGVTLKVRDAALLGESKITVNGDGGFEVISGTCADGMCTVAYGKGAPLSLAVVEKTFLKGDVNADGSIDNMDAAVVLAYDAGSRELSDGEMFAADVNNDGFADNLDAAMILRYDAGLIDKF